MNPARWREIKSTFDEALKLEPSLRSRFMQNLAATDDDLRQRVESLLAEHEHDSNPFLGDPAAGLSIFGDLVGTDPWLGKQIGPYKLVRELGSGGMGEVYLARRVDAEFEQTVAIKLMTAARNRPPSSAGSKRSARSWPASTITTLPSFLMVAALRGANRTSSWNTFLECRSRSTATCTSWALSAGSNY